LFALPNRKKNTFSLLKKKSVPHFFRTFTSPLEEKT
jgi:hypothetical protein